MSTLDERIANAEKRLKQLKAQQQQNEARKRAATAKKRRADDTRRKVLVGAAILTQIESGRMSKEPVDEIMAKFLTRDDDRALFGLAPIHEDSPAQTQSQ